MRENSGGNMSTKLSFLKQILAFRFAVFYKHSEMLLPSRPLTPSTCDRAQVGLCNGAANHFALRIGVFFVVALALNTTSLVAQVGGCGNWSVQTGGYTSDINTMGIPFQTTDGNGTVRNYKMLVPNDYDASQAYPVTFLFHGAGGDHTQSLGWGMQFANGAAESGIFVFPDGIDYQGYGIGWDDAGNGRDLPFFDNMLQAVESTYCIDTTRVFVAGFSWGGDFVTSLACNRGSLIRGAAVNSASDDFGTNSDYTTYFGYPCPSPSYPAIRFGHEKLEDDPYPAPYFDTTSQLFRSFAGCQDNSSYSVSSGVSTSSMSCVQYASCSNQVIECSFNGVGHMLPNAWGQDTWTFFSNFPPGS